MPRIEIITITNGRNNSKKNRHKFLIEELGAIKNSVILIINYIFYQNTASTDLKNCKKLSMPGLFAFIEVFL